MLIIKLLMFNFIANVSVLQINNDNSKKLQNELEVIIKKIFLEDDCLVYVYKNSYGELLPHPNRNSRFLCNYETENGFTNQLFCYNYVIYATDDEFNRTLNTITRSTVWNHISSPRGKFVYVAVGLCSKQNVFELFWSKQIINTIVIETGNPQLNSFTCHMFSEENRCGETVRPKLLGNVDENILRTQADTLKNCNFVVELYNDNYPYPYVDTSTRKLTGTILNVLHLFEEKFRVNLSLRPLPDEMQVDLLKSVPITIKHLQTDEANAVAAVAFRQSFINFQNVVEFTNIVFYDTRIWIVPKAKKVSNVQTFKNLFSDTVWLLHLFTVCFTLLIFYFVSVVKKDNNRGFFETFVVLFGVTLGTGGAGTPNSGVLKTIFLFYLVYVFHVNYFFQGKLNSVLTVPQYEKKINSVEELLRSDLEIFLPNSVKEKLKTSTNPSASFIYERSVSVSDTKNKRHCVVLRNRSVASNILASSIPDSEKMLLDFFVDDLFPSTELSYYMKRGNPFAPVLNKLIVAATEAGLDKKWLSDLKKVNFVASSEKLIVLSIEHFETAFLILFYGLLCAFVIFLIELIYHFWKNSLIR